MSDVSRKTVGSHRMTSLALSERESDRREMRVLLRKIGGPGARTKTALDTICKELGLGWNRARELYYGDRRAVVRPHELELARSIAEQKKAVSDAYQQLLARIERLERALLLADAEFAGPQVAGLREAVLAHHNPPLRHHRPVGA
jgi:hypothetical protein